MCSFRNFVIEFPFRTLHHASCHRTANVRMSKSCWYNWPFDRRWRIRPHTNRHRFSANSLFRISRRVRHSSPRTWAGCRHRPRSSPPWRRTLRHRPASPPALACSRSSSCCRSSQLAPSSWMRSARRSSTSMSVYRYSCDTTSDLALNKIMATRLVDYAGGVVL